MVWLEANLWFLDTDTQSQMLGSDFSEETMQIKPWFDFNLGFIQTR